MTVQRKKAQDKPAPKKNTNTYYNEIENICLALFGAFLLLFIGGYYIHNQPMSFLGLGLGFAGMIIQVHLNLSKEKWNGGDTE